MATRTLCNPFVASYVVLTMCAAGFPQPLSAQQTVVSFGSGSFSVDPGAVTASYKQSGQGIAFGPRISLGDSLGGTTAPLRFLGANNSLGLVMRLASANSSLPFSLETFDAKLNVTARFQGQTTGAGGAASFVPLKLVEGSVQGTTIAGLQFTWDGAGPIDVELLSLATSASPTPAPTPVPAPTPAPAPTPVPVPSPSSSPAPQTSPGLSAKPVPDRTRPTVRITSPATVRGANYTLAARLADNIRPVIVQYRLRAPGARTFGKWTSVKLRNKASKQNWSQPRIKLGRRGVWTIQVRVVDAAKNHSLVPTLRVNRKR